MTIGPHFVVLCRAPVPPYRTGEHPEQTRLRNLCTGPRGARFPAKHRSRQGRTENGAAGRPPSVRQMVHLQAWNSYGSDRFSGKPSCKASPIKAGSYESWNACSLHLRNIKYRNSVISSLVPTLGSTALCSGYRSNLLLFCSV